MALTMQHAKQIQSECECAYFQTLSRTLSCTHPCLHIYPMGQMCEREFSHRQSMLGHHQHLRILLLLAFHLIPPPCHHVQDKVYFGGKWESSNLQAEKQKKMHMLSVYFYLGHITHDRFSVTPFLSLVFAFFYSAGNKLLHPECILSFHWLFVFIIDLT